MGVKLRVGGLQRHLGDVRVGPTFSVPPLDIDRRPRGVVLKTDPAELAGLDAITTALAPASNAKVCLGIGDRVGDGVAVNIQQGRPLRRGRRQAQATDNDLSAENVMSTKPTGGRVAWICRR
jgi:hypothetical protein